jgi:hypothetical protein
MAFGVVGWDEKNNMVTKNNPNYVRWRITINTYLPDTGLTLIPVKTHICNETDWSQFYPPNKYNKRKIQLLKGENTMICFDDG